MKPTTRRSTLMLALGLAATPASEAAVIDYTTAVVVGDSLRSDALGLYDVDLLDLQLLSLQRFDASLGTLQAVDIFLSGTWTALGDLSARDTRQEADSSLFPPFIVNDRNDTAIDGTVSTSLSFRLLDPLGAVGNFTLPSVSAGCSDTTRDVNGVVECSDSFRETLSLQRSLLLGALPLSSFIGTDPLNLSLLLTGNIRGYCDADDVGDLCGVEVGTSFQGVAGVRYSYALPGDGGTGGGDGGGSGGGDPVSVPEPGSLGLLAVGLLGIARIKRRVLRPER